MRNGRPKIKLTRRPGSRNFVLRFENPVTGNEEQRSTGTSNKKEAQRIAGELRSELADGRYHRDSGVSWEEFRDRYEAEHLSSLADMTLKKYDTVLDLVEEVLKPKRVSELTADRISSFVAKIRNGERTESTIAGYLRHLRAALNWAANVGILLQAPKINKPQRAKVSNKAKGRAPTSEEFQKILETVPAIVGEKRAPSWRHLIEGLWWSGLRLGEALELSWDRDDKLRPVLTQEHPLFQIPAELEKGHRDRLITLAPEFAELLLKTPAAERSGFVFNPRPEREGNRRLTIIQVTRIISRIGRNAAILVRTDVKTGKKKYASAHDFRRAFGDRWALRVMPAVLMVMMRHESIGTTMQFYVGRSAQATADVVWQAYARVTTAIGKEKGDSLGDSGPKSAKNGDSPKGGQ
ncbi:MAG: site-specific integrase [Gemmataceae bacterium]|nr:site-specific integrase [Gemmataceae bacterium]